jgi:hypothetical protein
MLLYPLIGTLDCGSGGERSWRDLPKGLYRELVPVPGRFPLRVQT